MHTQALSSILRTVEKIAIFTIPAVVFLVALYPDCSRAATGSQVEMAVVASVNEMEAGSLLLQQEGETTLRVAPTVDTDVMMDISGIVARVTVTQAFTNPTLKWLNGIYVFPLPETAAVDHMKMVIGERVIEGRIQRREEARKTYEQARQAGKKASLVEQQRPNLFTNNVANIGPGETIVVTIQYQETVAYQSAQFSIRFPMTVGVRYIPGTPTITGFDGGGWSMNTDQVQDASSITPPMTAAGVGHDNPVSLTVDLDAGLPISALRSSYHKIDTEDKGNHSYRVRLASGTVPADRDFELTWAPEPGRAPRAALFTQQHGADSYALLMMMPPEIRWAKQSALVKEMVFVIDTSGSMAGTSIRQAREALLLGLDRLKPDDRFNIIAFNSTTSALAPAAMAATPENLRRARSFVSRLKANGGTEMAGALRQALDGSDEYSLVRQVVFLTDGSVGNEARLFQIIDKRLGVSRLYTVGIGSAPNSYFMREAAAMGRGTFTYIGDVGEVKEEMDGLFEKLEYPVLSNIAMRWSSGAEADYWPNPVRDLYVHEPLVVSFKLAAAETALHLSGDMNGKPWSTTLPIGGGGSADGLDVLWARNKIRSLNQQKSRGTPADEIKEAVTALGLKHHIVTRHTSLVAVDATPSRPAGIDAVDAAVPNKMPKGWTMNAPQGRLPQTATPALLHLLLGLTLAMVSLLGARIGRGKGAGQ